MKKIWHEKAWEEYLNWLSQDKRVFIKICELVKSIDRDGYQCLGKPEMLAGEFSGWWSVRINHKDRLIFKIKDDSIIILQCKNHYSDR